MQTGPLEVRGVGGVSNIMFQPVRGDQSAGCRPTHLTCCRPNQSVILAGLGVTGAKVVTCRKDREYRSTQGAGYRPGSSTLIGQDIRDTVLSLVDKDI